MENKNTRKTIVGAVLLMIIGLIIIIFFGLNLLMLIALGDSFSFDVLVNLALMIPGIFMCYYSIKIFPKKEKFSWKKMIIFVSIVFCVFVIFFRFQGIRITRVMDAERAAENVKITECESNCIEDGGCFCYPYGYTPQPSFFDILFYKK